MWFRVVLMECRPIPLSPRLPLSLFLLFRPSRSLCHVTELCVIGETLLTNSICIPAVSLSHQSYVSLQGLQLSLVPVSSLSPSHTLALSHSHSTSTHRVSILFSFTHAHSYALIPQAHTLKTRKPYKSSIYRGGQKAESNQIRMREGDFF